MAVRGNRYIIAIIDSFTRWIGLYGVRDVTAECAVDALIEHFGTFGCPAQLLSDNGSQFVNELIREFTKLIGTLYLERTLNGTIFEPPTSFQPEGVL